MRSAGGAGTARWRKCGPAAQRRANGVAYSADNRASGLLCRLLEVLPRGLRRLWDGAPCHVTLAQFPARQYLAGKIRFFDPVLYYNYPLFTRLMHLLGARLGGTSGAVPRPRELSQQLRSSAEPLGTAREVPPERCPGLGSSLNNSRAVPSPWARAGGLGSSFALSFSR